MGAALTLLIKSRSTIDSERGATMKLTNIAKGFAQVVVDGKVIGDVYRYSDIWGRAAYSWEPVLYYPEKGVGKSLGVVFPTRKEAVKALVEKV